MKRGFTLLEVMIATIILSTGLMVLLTAFAQCQRIMTFSRANETAHYVLTLGEAAHPIPDADQVTDDPFESDLLNVEETPAQSLMDELDVNVADMPRERLEELADYTFERTVDEVDDEELSRSGHLYTLRTTVRWGSPRAGRDREELRVLTFWRKKP